MTITPGSSWLFYSPPQGHIVTAKGEFVPITRNKVFICVDDTGYNGLWQRLIRAGDIEGRFLDVPHDRLPTNDGVGYD